MCNGRSLLIAAAVAGAVYTGGSSLGLLGGAGGGAAAGAGAGAGAGAAASGLSTAQMVGLASAAVSAASSYQQAQTQKAVAENNAKAAETKAQADERQGELNAQKVQEQASQLAGTQRATMAARGLDLGAGTPADIINQTSFFSQQDAATARYNGQMNAWADRQQGAGFSAQASGYGSAANLSLLAGAGTVADKWYRYTDGRPYPPTAGG